RKKQLQANATGQLAMLAMSRKDWTVAKGYLSELLDLQPNDARALQLLGQVLFEEGKTSESLEKLKAAKAANKDVLTPEATLAIWFQNAGDGKKAQEYMVAALNAAPQDYNTRLQAAQWALRIESLDTARKQAEDALKLAEAQKLDPTPALLAAGTIAIFQNDYAAAEKHLRQAVANQPANFSATNNLATALSEQDDEAKRKLALAYAEVNYRLYSDNLEAASTYGRALFQLGQLQAAAQVFARIQASGRPLSKDTAFYLAVLLAKSDQGREQARTLLKEILGKEGLFSQKAAAEKLAKELGM
ncbi:MAG: tetratricopeptide repeat protein, partial [Pirellulaceae bacterium]|nr:tetratricopeptide repeat protein [Pirellulaceae bacterium]